MNGFLVEIESKKESLQCESLVWLFNLPGRQCLPTFL